MICIHLYLYSYILKRICLLCYSTFRSIDFLLNIQLWIKKCTNSILHPRHISIFYIEIHLIVLFQIWNQLFSLARKKYRKAEYTTAEWPVSKCDKKFQNSWILKAWLMTFHNVKMSDTFYYCQILSNTFWYCQISDYYL